PSRRRRPWRAAASRSARATSRPWNGSSRSSAFTAPVELFGGIGDNAAMNLVDLGIIVVIGLGVLIGWRNGLIGALLAEGAVLLGLVGAGTVLDPLLQARSTVQSSQVAAMQMLLAENPQVAGFVPSGELGQLATVASVHPVPLAQLGQYAQVINYYERTLRPQLATSQLAPLVLRYGARLPIIGRHVTLPKA